MGRRTWQGRWGTAGGCNNLYNSVRNAKCALDKVQARRPGGAANSSGSATGADPFCRIRDPGPLPLWPLDLWQAPGARAPAHGSPEAFVCTRFRCLRWWHSGICGASLAPRPLPWSLGRAPERPWGPGRPRPPGRPKPDPHSGQFPQAHDENSDTISYGADPGNLPPPKAGKPEMC